MVVQSLGKGQQWQQMICASGLSHIFLIRHHDDGDDDGGGGGGGGNDDDHYHDSDDSVSG